MRPSNLLLVTVLVLGVLVKESMLQGFQIDNNTLFTLGAVALASGVAYHVGRQHGNGGRRPHNEGGFNGGGFNGGGFGRFPFFGRRRRQAEDPLNELDPLVGELFQMALKRDNNGCSLQLVCSVGNKPTSSLSGHAKILEGILSTNQIATKTKGQWGGLDAYHVALNLGRDGGNCDQLFPNCPNSSEQLMDAFQVMEPVEI